MKERFEPKNIDEVDNALKHFNEFHDGYVEGIEIKFENYKSIKDNGVANGIGAADMTIVLTVNAYPYGEEHNQLVRVEFLDVKSFDIIHERGDNGMSGPDWGICHASTDAAPSPHEDEIFWDFYFLCGKAKYEVTCAKLVFVNLGYTMHQGYSTD